MKNFLLGLLTLPALLSARYAYVNVCLHLKLDTAKEPIIQDGINRVSTWKLLADNNHYSTITINHGNIKINKTGIEGIGCGKFFRRPGRDSLTNFIEIVRHRDVTANDIAYFDHGFSQ